MGYRTIAAQAQAEHVEKKSRFIGTIIPAETETEAMAFIAEMRKKHYDASHNVYAYLLREGQMKRYSDDGEPQGTGGVPALSVLERSGLVDVCVVVTRYFGGTLLGAGGLVRAYGKGASLAVEAAEIRHMVICKTVVVEMEYGVYDKFNYLLPEYQAVTKEVEYQDHVRVVFLLKEELVPGFSDMVRELTGGKSQVHVIGEEYADMDD